MAAQRNTKRAPGHIPPPRNPMPVAPCGSINIQSAAEPSLVFGQIGSIDGALDYTGELIDQLERKLSTILIPPGTDTVSTGDPIPATTLGAALGSTRALAVRNNGRLNDLLDRIVL